MKRGFLNGSKAKARPLGPVPGAVQPVLGVLSLAFLYSAPNPNNPAILSELPRFPIGKVDVALPEGYEGGGSTLKYMKCSPGTRTTPDMMICTTLPLGAKPDEPVTECFFFHGSKEVLTSLPGFPKPLTHPTTPAFCMAPTPGKGTGLFSTRALKTGDLILSERPLFVTARGVVVPCPEGFTHEQHVQYSLNELEKYMALSVSRMRPEDKAALMALANSHKEDGSGPIVGIVRTNGLQLEGLRPGVTDELATYSATCKDISRLNHSCSPNTAPRFDMLSFSYQLFAVRDIAKDEELTFQYTGVDCSAANRNTVLKSYAFVCTCTACLDAPASDARRAAIVAFNPAVQAWAFKAERKLADDWLLDRCRKHLALIVREGLEHLPVHRAIVTVMMETYICLGDAQHASEWAAKLDKFLWEEKRPDVKELLDPASAAYEAHPMWRARIDGPPIEAKQLLSDFQGLMTETGSSTMPWGMVFPMA
ncbi:hypothetical protein C8R44DRAFT_914822 [Mycena epipterygia]|nr:hypothetical protein C8R44DRAFT_914822 [Mycena epipterygia]